jgi:hypothetical protein
MKRSMPFAALAVVLGVATTATHAQNMKDGKPAYTYNFLGLARYTVAAPEALPARPATETLDYANDGGGIRKGGKAT